MFTPSLPGILRSLTRLAAKLESHAERAIETADRARSAAAELHARADAHDGEAAQASRVAARVKSLLS